MLPTRRPRLHIPDPLALLATAVLIAAGIVNLWTIDRQDLADHQALAVFAGLLLMFVLRRAHVRSLPMLGRAAYVTALVMLAAVLVAGAHAYGARRWLVVGAVVLQPSEMAKLGLLLVMADAMGQNRVRPQRLLLALTLAAIPIALTLLQPDLSTAFLLGVVVVAVLLGARVRLRAVIVLIGSLALLTPLAVRLLRPYQAHRLNAFLSGTTDTGSGWSVLQSHVAIASGGLFGTNHQNLHLLLAQYLPARQTDLAYASLVEQWGLVAGALVLLAAVVLVWRLVAAARVARTRTASLVATGLAALIGVEVGVSAAGNLGVLPLAGVPFPFLSYGGTSAAAHLAAVGLVLAACRDAVRYNLWTPPRWNRKRPRLAGAVATLIAMQLAILATLTWQLQASGDGLREVGLAQMTRCVPLWAPRGAITDRHGTVLAVDQQVSAVLATPRLLLARSGAPERLASLVQMQPPDLRRLLSKQLNAISVNVAEVSSGAGQRVSAAELPGVVVTPVVRRTYPYGSLLGPLLGYVGIASPQDMARRPSLAMGATVGRSGLERQYDNFLGGAEGANCVLVDPVGIPVAPAERRDPQPGLGLRLTLDLGLQQRATSALAVAMHGMAKQPPGDLGAALVLDAHTGAVLAMASLPSYDDSIYGPPANTAALSAVYRAAGAPMLEHATQVAAPPGSTFKLVAASADTVYNAIPPSEVIPTGYTFSFAGQTFHGWGPLPPQNLTQAIAWSNDVYFYKLALALGPDRIKSVGAQLGAGEPTGIDLPGENPGFLGTPSLLKDLGQDWWPGASVILGIGQGNVTATPLQVARWTAATATGRLVMPHLGLASAGGPNGGDTWLVQQAAVGLPFAAGLSPVRDGLRMAVSQGTAGGLRDLPVPAGAKTGSAEDPAAPGTHVDAWYSAELPAGDPEIVVTVFVHGGGEGHLTGEPVARSIVDYYLAHRNDIQSTPPAANPYPVKGLG